MYMTKIVYTVLPSDSVHTVLAIMLKREYVYTVLPSDSVHTVLAIMLKREYVEQ